MPDAGITRVSDDEIRTLSEDGAVALRGVFDAAWIEMLRDGVEDAMTNPGPFAKDIRRRARDGSSPTTRCS